MKLRKLNPGLNPFVIALMMLFVITACNNSDKEEKSSTTTTDTSVSRDGMVDHDTSRSKVNNDLTTTTDPSGTAKTTTKTTTAKKPGAVYARPIMADSRAKTEMDKAGITSYPDVMPKYPGGQMALENYIENNIEYPAEALENNVEGTVFVLFLIDENGNISETKLYGAKLGYGLDEAAIKVISQMPKWTPGKLKGTPVKAWFTFPVTYRLEPL